MLVWATIKDKKFGHVSYLTKDGQYNVPVFGSFGTMKHAQHICKILNLKVGE